MQSFQLSVCTGKIVVSANSLSLSFTNDLTVGMESYFL